MSNGGQTEYEPFSQLGLNRQAICSNSITTHSGRSGCFWSMSIQSVWGGFSEIGQVD
jgi:hypothetical protein